MKPVLSLHVHVWYRYNFTNPVFEGSDWFQKLRRNASRSADIGCSMFLLYSVLFLIVFVVIGVICDAVVWGKANQYYTRILPLFGILLGLLFGVSTCVSATVKDDPKMEERASERCHIFVVICQFIALHFFIAATSETGSIANDEFFTNQQVEALLPGES